MFAKIRPPSQWYGQSKIVVAVSLQVDAVSLQLSKKKDLIFIICPSFFVCNLNMMDFLKITPCVQSCEDFKSNQPQGFVCI